jgi:hypothetical protein
VRRSNNELAATVKKAAEILNLKEHLVGFGETQHLHVCGDIEGHHVRLSVFRLCLL